MTEPADLEAPLPAEADLTVPTLEAAMLRLRIDEDLAADVRAAIPEAKAEAEAFLDGTLYATDGAKAAKLLARGELIEDELMAALERWTALST